MASNLVPDRFWRFLDSAGSSGARRFERKEIRVLFRDAFVRKEVRVLCREAPGASTTELTGIDVARPLGMTTIGSRPFGCTLAAVELEARSYGPEIGCAGLQRLFELELGIADADVRRHDGAGIHQVPTAGPLATKNVHFIAQLLRPGRRAGE